MGVPNVFGSATTSIPLSQLDQNFNTPVTIGNTTVGLGNTVTTIGNLTLTNVTIASGTVNASANSIINGTSNVVIASSGGAVNIATNGTQAITVDTSQNVGIGIAPTASEKFAVKQTAATQQGIWVYASANDSEGRFFCDGSSVGLAASYSSTGSYLPITFTTSATERMRIDSSGNLLVGATSGSNNYIGKTGSEGSGVLTVGVPGLQNIDFFGVNGTGVNASATGIKVQKNSSTNRSINAAGTINASGADYAEYMVKAGDFIISKGDLVGIDANGKLTNIFADAISFVVKSTNPSYVGGDTWGTDLKGNDLEVARETVDRIAFSGQVPVNVIGATAGQYIIPVNDNGAIKGEKISNPTFEQYQLSVGKVIAIESDGRAKIIVKVA